MPLTPASKIQSRYSVPLIAPSSPAAAAPPPPDPTWFETLGSMFGSEYTPTAVYNSISEWTSRSEEYNSGEYYDAEFDPFDAIKGTDLEAHPDAFIDVYTRPQFERRAAKIRAEIADRDIISRSPLWAGLTTGLLTGALDPVNYVAFAGPVSRSMAALKGGRAALTFAKEGATAGLLSTVASEALLQNDQYLRTMEESAVNVAMATGLGAGLGGVVGAAVSRNLKKAAAGAEKAALDAAIEGRFRRAIGDEAPEVPGSVTRDMTVAPDAPGAPDAPQPIPANDAEIIPANAASASAAAVAPDTIEIAGTGVAGAVARGLSAPSRVRGLGWTKGFFDNPVAWMLTSPFRAVREIAERLSYSPMLSKNADGIATAIPAEALASIARADGAAVTRMGRELFSRYRLGPNAKAGILRAKIQDMTGNAGGRLDFKAFKAAAYDVVRDGNPHPIPEVNELATEITKRLDRIKQEAIEVGALPADVAPGTAANYIMRLYDTPKIIAQRRRFETILAKWMRENKEALRTEAVEARKVVDDLKAQRDALRAEMTPDEWAIYESERKWQAAQKRVEQASAEQKKLEDAAQAADGRLQQLLASPNAPELQDLIAKARDDLQIAQDDLGAAIAEHNSAMQDRDIARTQYSFRNDKLKSHPINKARQRLQRRQAHLDLLKAQAEIAQRNLKTLDAELEQAGRGPKVYAEWLDRRADKMPPGKRPMSLVDLIIARGGLRDDGGELRKIIEKSVGKTKAGTADRRLKLAKLISKDENAPKLDDATLTYWEEGYLGKFDSNGESERPDLRELIDAIDAEASTGIRHYSYNDLDNTNAWEDYDWAKARRDELRADPDFKAGRAITTLINKWKKQAAAKVAEVDAKGAIILRERDAARASMDKMIARATDMERARRTLEKRIEHETARAESFEDVYYKSDEELPSIVTALVDDLLGMPGEATASNLSEIGAKRRGPLADRTLLIPDTFDAGRLMIDGVDGSGRFDEFVVKDVDRVMHAVARSTGPDLALRRTFGSVDLEDEFARIAEDAKAHRQAIGLKQEKALIAARERGASDAEIAKIVKAGEREMRRSEREQTAANRLLKVQVARLRGTFTGGLKPDSLFYRFAENAKTLNYIRLMGAAVPASLADATMVARAHGLDRVINAARVAAGDWESFKAAMKTAPQVGQAIDRVLSMRSAAIGDLDNAYFARSKPEEILQFIGQKFGNVNLLSQWTDFWKSFDVVVAQDRILNNVAEFMDKGTLSATERQFMADHYIDERGMALLYSQWGKTKNVSGLRWAEMADWDNSEAKRLFSAALARNADFNVITPGLDKPVWLSTPVGSVIGQFKSYTFVAMNRILVSSLQQDAASAAMGLSLLTLGGAMSYMVSSALKLDNPFDEPPEKWAAEAIDRSGMVGWLTEVNAFADKFGIGINTALGGRELSRYASRSAIDQMFGPTFGMVTSGVDFASAALSGEKDLTGQNVGFARQMIPGNNLFYMRWLFDNIEAGTAETLGVTPRPSVRRE
jgi:hypothetical protein